MAAVLRTFTLWLLQVLVLAGLLLFFLWLMIRPSSPSYYLTSLSFPISNSSNSSTVISFSIEISNTNKAGGVIHKDLNISLYFLQNIIGSTAWPPFHQGHEKTTKLAGEVKPLKAVAVNGTAEVKLAVATAVKYNIAFWKSRLHSVQVEVDVPVGVDGLKKRMKLHGVSRRRSRRWLRF